MTNEELQKKRISLHIQLRTLKRGKSINVANERARHDAVMNEEIQTYNRNLHRIIAEFNERKDDLTLQLDELDIEFAKLKDQEEVTD